MSDPTNGPLEQHVSLAGQTAVWGSLAVLTWFFPIVGFIFLVALTLFSLNQFIIAYKIHQTLEESDRQKEVKDDSSPYEQPALTYPDGTELGTERSGRLRENLSESKE